MAHEPGFAGEGIEVSISMHGYLRARHAQLGSRHGMRVPAGTTVAQLLDGLGHTEEAWLVGVNGCAVPTQHCLHDADRLDIFPALEGG